MSGDQIKRRRCGTSRLHCKLLSLWVLRPSRPMALGVRVRMEMLPEPLASIGRRAMAPTSRIWEQTHALFYNALFSF